MNSDTNFQKYEHEKQKELNDKNYQRGYEDGLISAGQKAYENGFREGVQFGIENGYFTGYINTMKKFVDKYFPEDKDQDKIIIKVKALFDKYDKLLNEGENLEEIKKLYKILISSLKSLSKKTGKV